MLKPGDLKRYKQDHSVSMTADPKKWNRYTGCLRRDQVFTVLDVSQNRYCYFYQILVAETGECGWIEVDLNSRYPNDYWTEDVL